MNSLRRPFQGRALPVSYPGTGQSKIVRAREIRSKGLDPGVTTHFDFWKLFIRKDAAVKRSTFARTAIAPSVQGDELAPIWPGRERMTAIRVPGNSKRRGARSSVGN